MLADPTLTNQELLSIVNRCEGQPITIRVYPDLFQMLVSEASVTNFQGLTLVGIRATELQAWQRTLKRAFDLAFSVVRAGAHLPADARRGPPGQAGLRRGRCSTSRSGWGRTGSAST